jgi:F0F1-type ATP synthase membrane subunit b/b'
MGETLSRLGQLFVQSTPTVIFVFLLLIILDRLFFRRLDEVLREREGATRGALARARTETATAEAKWQEYEAAFQAARQEVYRQREIDRREALNERGNSLQKAREQTDSWLADSRTSLAAQLEAAKKDLSQSSRTLAQEIAEMILGDGASGGREARPRR